MAETAWSEQPDLFIQVAAQTAKTTLVELITAGSAGTAYSIVALPNVMQETQGVQGPVTYGPKATRIPEIPFGSAAYFQTNPFVYAGATHTARIEEALRKAESWGWSRALSVVTRAGRADGGAGQARLRTGARVSRLLNECLASSRRR